jgi:DNA-directed RNA polymerase specialized sigma24 family protein
VIRKSAMIDLSTKSRYFRDWNSFTGAYYDVILSTMASLEFVPRDLVQDWTQSFFADKLIARGLFDHVPKLSGQFRSFLFTMVRNYAVDKWRQLSARGKHEVAWPDAGLKEDNSQPAAIPVMESDALYALAYFAVALRIVRTHWEKIDKGEKWRIFDSLVLAAADPDAPHTSRSQLLAELHNRDAQYLDNCITTIKRSIRAVLPRILPAELSAHANADDRVNEFKEILRAIQLANFNWLRWAAPVSWAQCIFDAGANMNLSDDINKPNISQDKNPSNSAAEHERDLLHLEQLYILALPFSEYSGDLAAREGHVEDTLDNLLVALEQGAPAMDQAALVARMQALKQYGKRKHREAKRESMSRTLPPPRELGYLLYTVASAVALVGTDQHIDTLGPKGLAVNVAWALEQPWLEPRLRPILQQAHKRLWPSPPDTQAGQPGSMES